MYIQLSIGCWFVVSGLWFLVHKGALPRVQSSGFKDQSLWIGSIFSHVFGVLCIGMLTLGAGWIPAFAGMTIKWGRNDEIRGPV